MDVSLSKAKFPAKITIELPNNDNNSDYSWLMLHDKTLHPTFIWLARSGRFFYKVVGMIKVRAGGSKRCYLSFPRLCLVY